MTEKSEKKERREQKQKKEQKKRTLHDKHRERRKRDVMPNLPFILGFQGDPARNFYCNDENQRDISGNPNYELIPRTKRGYFNRGLSRLSSYFSHKITKLLKGKMLIYRAA